MGRWARRAFLLLVTLIGIGCAIYVAVDLLLPGQVRRVVDNALEAAGLDNVNYDVRIATPWNTVLTHVSRGDGLRIGAISVNYSPLAVIHGEVTSIQIFNADIDPLRLPNITRRSQATTTQTDGIETKMPERIDIVASWIRFNYEERPLRLPIMATITRQEQGVYSIAARSFYAGSRVDIAGIMHPDGSVDVRLGASPNLSSLWSMMSPRMGNPPAHYGGNTDLSLDARIRGNAASCEFEIKSNDAWFDHDDLHASRGRFDLAGTIMAHLTDSSWGVQLTSLKGSGTTDLMLPGQIALRDVGFGVDATGQIDDNGMELHLLPQSRMRSPDVRWRDERAAMSLVLNSPWDFVQKWNDDWSIAAGPFTLQANSQKFSKLRKPSAVLKMAGTMNPRELALDMLDGSSIFTEALAAGSLASGPIPINISHPRAIFYTQAPDRSMPSQGVLSVALNAATTQPVKLSSGNTSANIGQASASLTYSNAAGKSLAGQLVMQASSLHHDDIDMNGISLELPIDLADVQAPEGHIKSDEVVINGEKFPGVSGAFDVSKQELKASLIWPALKSGSLKAVANVNWSGPVTRSNVELFVPPFDLTQAKEIQKFTSGKDLEATGQLSADARFSYDGNAWSQNASLHVANATLRSKQYDADLSGIDGNVSFTSLSPPTTGGNQLVKVAHAKLGKLDVTDGSIQFRLENLRSLFVEAMSFNFAGGSVSSRGFRFDPASNSADMVVLLDHVQVPQVLQLITDKQISGDGWVYGKIPVNIAWPKFSFGNGYLYAGPEGGSLVMPDAGGQIKDLLEKSDPRFKDDPTMSQVRDRVVAAIEDFKFTVFRVDMHDQNGKLITTVTLKGKGTKGPNPQELNLNLNLEDLDWLLEEYLAVERKMSGK